MKDEREQFEEAAFAQYFLSTIKRNNNVPQPRISGALDFVSDTKLTQAEFGARNEDGSYKEPTLNPAWWAWQRRAALAPEGKE